jgi:uncharacterized GH25 family protein
MKTCIGTALLMLLTWFSFGHDMWLESSSYRMSPGQEVVIRAGNGTILEQSENAVSPDRIAKLVGMSPQGNQLLLGTPYLEGNWLQMHFRPLQSGNYWIGMATRPRLIELSSEQFNDYLRHDGLPHVLREREALGITDREEIEEYSKYGKIYLQVGTDTSDNYRLPVGLKIEIIPEKNPYLLKPGDDLPLQVLYQGKPLTGFLVHAGRAGQERKTVHRYTDKSGRASIPLAAAGRWFIRGIHLLQTDGSDHSYESYWATVTFEVKAR